MNRLTKTGTVSAKDINELLDENSENQMGKTNAYYKLQAYEDMEEALENVFGDCPDLLKTVVKTLTSTSHINKVNIVME